MSDDFLSRWSRRKTAAREGRELPAAAVIPAKVGTPFAPTVESPGVSEPAPLPPLESLTPESDFTPFMKAEVDPATRRQALKTLFADPQFNVMDGLDVYIDDYSKPDPLPEGWLAKMNQVARLGAYLEPDPEPAADGAESSGAQADPLPPVSAPDTPPPPAGDTTEPTGRDGS